MTVRPWLNESIYAPYKLAALVETLTELGFPSDEILRGTGLTHLDIDNPESQTSVGQYFTACRNAIRISKNPATPFLIGRKMHLSAYGMYGYALMCSVTLRDFFNSAVRYHKLATPIVVIDWRETEDEAIWFFPRLASPELSADLHSFLIEQQLVQHVIHMKDVAGPDCKPILVELSYAAPAHAKLYEQYLGCPVEFDRPVCELHYDVEILEHAPQLAHKLTSTLMQSTCERLIGQAKTSWGFSGQIYQMLMMSAGQIPTMEQTASKLFMNERTMRRKLEQEGTSFGEILEDVRSSLAKDYLKTTKMTTEDVAVLVGFSDVANFRRAFKKWTGCTPTDFRGGKLT